MLAGLLFFVFGMNTSAESDDFNLDFDDPVNGVSDVDPENIIEMKVQIENVVDQPMSFEMKILNDDDLLEHGIDVWWSHNGDESLTSRSNTIPEIDVSDNSVKNGITVSVEATENAEYGDYYIEIRCKDKDSDDLEEISLGLTVNEKAAVLLELPGDDTIGSVDINNHTTYMILVTNNGNQLDTFSLTWSGNDWDVDLDDSIVTIEAFSTEWVTLTITTGDDVYFGDDDSVTLTATSENDPSVDYDLSITTQVRVRYGLEFSAISNSVSGEPGATVSFNFKLVNKWSESINYEVSKKDWYIGTQGNRPEGWSDTTGTGALDGFQETNSARFQVTISSGADAGEVVTIIVEAIASDDQGSGGYITIAVEVYVEAPYNVQLIVPDSNEINLNAEQLVTMSPYIRVKNFATVNDLIYVSAEWEIGGNHWIVDTPEPINLSSNEEKGILISVKAPKADAGGQATLKIRVESGGDSSAWDEQSMILRVNHIYGCTNELANNYNSNATLDDGSCDWPVSLPIALAGQDVSISPGETVQFNGAGTDEDGTIVKYEWDFDGDGVYEWSSEENGRTTNIYNNPGTYNPSLRVTDNGGNTATDSLSVIVKSPEEEESGLPSISIITSLISMGLLVIFRRK